MSHKEKVQQGLNYRFKLRKFSYIKIIKKKNVILLHL